MFDQVRRISIALLLAVWAVIAHAQTPTVLKILWEVNTGSDYMTVESAAERDAYTNRGAFMYVPYGSAAGRTALYRLFNGTDHMTSHVYGEGGYSSEGILGYPWTSPTSVLGLGQLHRRVNPSTGDHAEVRAGDTISGYTVLETPGLYGYPRYNNVAEELLTLTAGGITMKSNLVAGGSIWSWVWNGIEFVDHYDYGREIQNDIDWTSGGVLHIPTMAGSTYSTDAVAGNRQGSPIYSASNSGSTQSTRAIPLEWNPNTFGGNSVHPVIYSDMLLGKDVTLNYNNMGSVAKYDTVLSLASSVSLANLSTPIGYVPKYDGRGPDAANIFDKYYTYDAKFDTLSPASPVGCGTSGFIWTPSSGHGGVIIANGAEDAAIGVAAKTTAASGKVGGFQLTNCISGQNVSSWSAFTGHITQPSGTSTVTTFVVTETLNNVKAKMRQLYLNGDI